MNKHHQETLGNLLKAAEQDQAALCLENLKKLLPEVDRIDALIIIVKRVRRFLSDFSHAHPEDDEIRKSIEAFNHITSLEALSRQGQLTDALFEKYWDWPGVSSFRNAFKGISKPQQYFEHSGEFVDTVISILLRILMAIEANNYWSDKPEYSNTFFGPDMRKTLLMLAKHHSSPKNVDMRRLLWTELARDLEIALQSH